MWVSMGIWECDWLESAVGVGMGEEEMWEGECTGLRILVYEKAILIYDMP